MFIVWIGLIFLFELMVFANTQFTLWPEIVLYPWLYNNGFLLYKDIINPYFPLLTWILADTTKIFGYEARVFLYLTWGYIFIIQLIFAFIVQKLFGSKKITVLSLIIYVMLLIVFEGNGLWYDLICTLPFLSAFYFLTKKESWEKYLITGVLFGIGLLIKQTTVWIIVLLIIYLFFLRFLKILNTKYLILNTILLIIPMTIMVVCVSLLFYFQEVFPDFFFWAITLPFGKLQSASGFIQMPTLKNWLVMICAFFPILVFARQIFKDKKKTLAAIFFISTFVFVFPRFGYFHLVASLPFFIILTIEIIVKHRKLQVAYFLLLIVISAYFFKERWKKGIRFFEKDIYQLAFKIKKETKQERFFLQNSPQQIYFINNSLPPKPWAINFPWYFEDNSLQKRITQAIVRDNIKFIVYEQGGYQPNDIISFIKSEYKVGKALNKKNQLMERRAIN